MLVADNASVAHQVLFGGICCLPGHVWEGSVGGQVVPPLLGSIMYILHKWLPSVAYHRVVHPAGVQVNG
jgi:hypothetical protein